MPDAPRPAAPRIKPAVIATVSGSIAFGVVRGLLNIFYSAAYGHPDVFAHSGAHLSILRFVNPYSIAGTAAWSIAFAEIWMAWAALRTHCRTNGGRLRVSIVVGTIIWLIGRSVIDYGYLRRVDFTWDLYNWLADVIALGPAIVWSFALASPSASGAVGTTVDRAARIIRWFKVGVVLVFLFPVAMALRVLLPDEDAVLVVPQQTQAGGAIRKYVPPAPTPASFVSDQRGLLAANAHALIDKYVGDIQRAGLGDIAVAILPSIGDYAPMQVAVEIYRTWKVGSVAAIGSARRDVGVLILIVPKELSPNHRGECWIATGTGAEGIITDATAAAICRDSIVPHLRAKEYAAAVEAGVSGVQARLRGDAGLQAAAKVAAIPAPPVFTPESPSPDALPWVLGALGVFAGFNALLLRWTRYRRRKCPRCGHWMHRLDEKADNAALDHGQDVEEQLGSVDYDVWKCDCGETTALPHRAWFSSYSECQSCHRRAASPERTELVPATRMGTGIAEDRFDCKACGASWTQRVTLPRIVDSGGSSGSGIGGGGGSSGGSSFGGSGSTSGGGGGSSY